MGKEFVEYDGNDGRISYSVAPTLCFCLTQHARNYIAQNRKIIANIDKNVRDAVLVDAINYLGLCGCCDFALYTHDLYSDRVEKEKTDGQYLLNVVQNYYATYIFQYGMVESVLRNNHMNDCTEKFDANDGSIVLVDFINYLAQVYGYDRTFTIKDLYEKFKVLEYKDDIRKLNDFLEKAFKYSEKLADGESINKIFSDMAKEHNLINITENKLRKMHPWIREEVEEEIYAMSYAYGKMFNDVKETPQIKIINKKIREMKKR